MIVISNTLFQFLFTNSLAMSCASSIWEDYDEEGNLIKTLTYKDGEVGQDWLAIFTKSARARSTFTCFLMILIQGIGRTIYQQAVRLTEVDQ